AKIVNLAGDFKRMSQFLSRMGFQFSSDVSVRRPFHCLTVHDICNDRLILPRQVFVQQTDHLLPCYFFLFSCNTPIHLPAPFIRLPKPVGWKTCHSKFAKFTAGSTGIAKKEDITPEQRVGELKG